MRRCQIGMMALICAGMIGGFEAYSAAQGRGGSRPAAGVCDREGAKIAGRKPVRVHGKIRAPKKIRDVQPSYKLPKGTQGSGWWIGEALIDANGKISRVWTLREPMLTPPFPAFNEAIVHAIEQWEFEPLRVNKVAVPVCMTVTMMLHWE